MNYTNFTAKRYLNFRLAQVHPGNIKQLGNELDNYLKDTPLKKEVEAGSALVYCLEDNDIPKVSIELHNIDGVFKPYRIAGIRNHVPDIEYRTVIEKFLMIEPDTRYYFKSDLELNNGYRIITQGDSLFGVVDKDLNYVLKPEYRLASTMFVEGKGIVPGVSRKDVVRFFDGDDVIVCQEPDYKPKKPSLIPQQYDFQDGYAFICKKGKVMVIDKTGKKSEQYDEVYPDHIYFIVKRDGKFGVIDAQYETIVPIEQKEYPYYHAGKFYAGEKVLN